MTNYDHITRSKLKKCATYYIRCANRVDHPHHLKYPMNSIQLHCSHKYNCYFPLFFLFISYFHHFHCILFHPPLTSSFAHSSDYYHCSRTHTHTHIRHGCFSHPIYPLISSISVTADKICYCFVSHVCILHYSANTMVIEYN